ncbi:MAG: TraB/GumN family protein [Acidobacteriota bacterium]
MIRPIRLLAALLGFALAIATASAEPAIWVVKSGGATVHLFGTIHALKPGTDWQTPKIEKAFAESEELWLEIADQDPATLRPVMLQLGTDPAHPLSSKLTPAERAQLDAAAADAGLGGAAALEPMRPWLAAVMLGVLPMIKAGYDPREGADIVLKAEAEAAHKPVHAFETSAQQMHYFADLPPPIELDFLRSTLDELAEGPAKTTALVQAWQNGDAAGIETLMLELNQEKYRDLYAVLIVARNRAWAGEIAKLLQGGDRTIFVAVGAGHLVGPDSLPRALEQLGLHAQRE